MDTSPIHIDTMIDGNALKHELTALIKQNGSADSMDQRRDVLQLLKSAKAQIFDVAEARLQQSGKGLDCACEIAGAVDALIDVIYEYAIHYVYPSLHQHPEDKIAVVAVGGYGRATLAPQSDIDLLFVLPFKSSGNNEALIEYILYSLWDLGFKVGHASRTVDECLKFARQDVTIQTNLLERRFLIGNEPLYDALCQKLDKETSSRSSARAFVEAKLAERDERHSRTGQTRYLVEPNVKESKGGLRDLHTLFWIIRFVYNANNYAHLIKEGVLTRKEVNVFRRCEAFLWTVRCHLHFLVGRPDEKLTFDLQTEIASRLGYHEAEGLKDVERFMKHYFIVAREVGNLTRIVCADLEVRHVKSSRIISRVLNSIGSQNKSFDEYPQFTLNAGRLSILSDDVFKQDPVNLLRIFQIADQHHLMLHPDATRLMTASLSLIKASLRQNEDANRIFLDILSEGNDPESTLRLMNELGILRRFMPEFGKIVAMMQFNMYHHYTVDEHLIRTVGVLKDIETAALEEEHPLAVDLISGLRHKRALYVAALIHDIAKGRPEDHSVAGAKVAKKLCLRLGLTQTETDLVSWLVLEHLTMSNTAQSRDISDPKTISDFAEVMQSLERLKHLLILTVCDIRAVGPGVWNGWKGQLLRGLYYATEPSLTGGHSTLSRQGQIAEAKEDLKAALKDWNDHEIDAYLERHYAPYWLRTPYERQIEHAKMLRVENTSDAAQVKFEMSTDAFKGITELTIYAPDHPNLLSMIAGACARANADIIDAQVFTTRDGYALDTVSIRRAFDTDIDEQRRSDAIFETLQDILDGKQSINRQMATPDKISKRKNVFDVIPIVSISNDLSNHFTVIECEAADRPGLLFDITAALASLNLNIASAHITTFGEKAVDSFYVTDLMNHKITSEDRKARILTRLGVVILPKVAKAA